MFPIWIGRLSFMVDALDLHEVSRKTIDDFIIVYLSNDSSDFELELILSIMVYTFNSYKEDGYAAIGKAA